MDADALPTPEGVMDTMSAQWAGLGRAGGWFDGAERVAIASLARGIDDGTFDASSPVPDAVRRVSQGAHSITEQAVAAWTRRGLHIEAYAELVGIVMRVVAMDTARRGLGLDEHALPDARPGSPARTVVPEAKRRAAFVPIIGGANPTTALSCVPGEAEDQATLHGALYLSYAEMADLGIEKWLHRMQMELVAARTSFLNECFY